MIIKIIINNNNIIIPNYIPAEQHLQSLKGAAHYQCSMVANTTRDNITKKQRNKSSISLETRNGGIQPYIIK